MPPLILVIALFVIIAFVVGVALLFRGYVSLPDPGKTASASELQKTQADLKASASETEKLRGQANTLAVQLDEMKGKYAWAEGNVKSLEVTLRKSSQAYTRLEQLEKDMQFLSQKADSQAREAIDVITRLAAETEVLKAQSAAPVSSAELDALKDENQKFEIQVDGYARKVKDLEAAVTAAATAAAAREAIKSEPAVPTVNVAAIEEELQRVRSQSEEKISQANAALVKLNSDVETFTAQVSEKDERIKKLSEEIFLMREELSASLRTVNELRQSQSAEPVIMVDPDKENIEQKRLEELFVAHQRLLDKEKILTYKLAQSRAHALSLQCLCDELKEQSERGALLK